MLRSIFIISGAGLVLYSKQIAGRPVDRMVGALLRTLVELASALSGGGLLTFLETRDVCIAMSQQLSVDAAPLYCALFYEPHADKAVSLNFGRQVAAHILSAFVEEYGGSSAAGGVGGGHIVGLYKAFGQRLTAILRDVQRSLIRTRESLAERGAASRVALSLTH